VSIVEVPFTGPLGGGSIEMKVKKEGEKYRCNVCGNEVVVTKAGGGELVCCGKSMEKIEG
jgi:desulfoferrodoxin-like iron-binding protein